MKTLKAIRGPALHFIADPFLVGGENSYQYESDALLILENGKIKSFGPYSVLKAQLSSEVVIDHYPNSLILPGFIDTHVHYPQTQMIGAYGKQLVDWLKNYTFIVEQQFSDFEHAKKVAKVFVDENLKAGTTTSVVYGTVHPHSVDAIFEAANVHGLRMIAGKVLMDRNAPPELCDTAQSGYDQSKKLIEKWHGKGRLSYAVTPRFAPTSTPEQLEMTGALWSESPGTYLQTHVSENKGEIAWVKDLFPEHAHYLDVYANYGLIGKRAILGHGIHFTEEEWQRCHDLGAAVSHCPTSNEFLGSGLFSFEKAKKKSRPVRVGLATDIGAGTTFSALQTMNAAYKVSQLSGYSLSAFHAFYLATRGAAQALYLDDKIGSLHEGMEADLVVLNLRSSSLIDFRMNFCKSIEETLFIQMILGDDRATEAVYIAGEKKYSSQV